jgi:hypothetical protein
MTETIIYRGRVTQLHKPPEISYVALVDLSTGKLEKDVPADSERLITAGLQPNDEFEIVIQSDKKSSKNLIRKIQTQLEFNL